MAEYRTVNRVKIAAVKRKYRASHKVEIAEYGASWYKAGRCNRGEEYVLYQARYRRDNREKVAALKENWQRNNLDKRAASDAKRRAIKNNAMTEELPDNYECGLYEDQFGCCYYCGCNLGETGHHLEHMIPLSRGGPHKLSNLVLSCPTCNLRKGTKTAEEFLEQNFGDKAKY